MSEISFEGRVAVVSGAGGGLGKTYALQKASRGASLVVNAQGGSADRALDYEAGRQSGRKSEADPQPVFPAGADLIQWDI